MTVTRRALAPLVGAALAVALLGGCAAEVELVPDLTPSAAFSTEEEAFAAAEETYRAYAKAFNEIDLGDNSSFDAVLIWLGGEAEDSTRKMLSRYYADGFSMQGATETIAFELEETDIAAGTVTAHICEDVSTVDVLDREGVSQVAATRPALQNLKVQFARGTTSTTLVVVSIEGSEEQPCA